MGRGGGMSGGRSGGHSSGGSHGFSSSRSSSRSHSSSGSIHRGASSRSSSYHSYSNSHYRRPSSRYTNIGPIFTGGGYGGYSHTVTKNQSTGVRVFLWLLVFVAIILFVEFGCKNSSVLSGTSSSGITTVTHTHEKMNREGVTQCPVWLNDSMNWLGNDSSEVVQALSYFMNKTGVQPYLVISDSINNKHNFTDAEAEAWLDNMYWEMFDDDGHMIVAFIEYEESVYVDYVYTGRLANGTIDTEARNIIMDYFDKYYTDTTLSDAEYFSKVFKSSADAIMVDYEANVKTNASRTSVMIWIIGALIVGGVIIFVIVRRNRAKKEAYEAAQKLASTPIDSQIDDTIGDDLENKYL